MKKGGVIAYGAIVAILIIGSFVTLYVTKTGPVSASIATKEGTLISFENRNILLLKSLDLGVKFISQRAAYELGKTGGVSSPVPVFWTETYPQIDDLKKELEEKISEMLPSLDIVDRIEIEWGDTNVTIESFSSKDFKVVGEKKLSVYDETTSSRTNIEHDINSVIKSSYFRLLEVGREILENVAYSSLLNDEVLLESTLNNDFKDEYLRFTITPTILSDETDILDIVIRKYYCPDDFSCFAPLTSEETGITYEGEDILFDYFKLHFRVGAEQTGFTIPTFDFQLLISPGSGDKKVLCI